MIGVNSWVIDETYVTRLWEVLVIRKVVPVLDTRLVELRWRYFSEARLGLGTRWRLCGCLPFSSPLGFSSHSGSEPLKFRLFLLAVFIVVLQTAWKQPCELLSEGQIQTLTLRPCSCSSESRCDLTRQLPPLEVLKVQPKPSYIAFLNFRQ